MRPNNAIKSYYGIAAKDVIEQSVDFEPTIIEINGQNYKFLPYEIDSDCNESLILTTWKEAEYINIEAQYTKFNKWLSCGTDKYEVV